MRKFFEGGRRIAADAALRLLETAQHELMLFAAAGFLLGAIDDLLVDLFWFGRALWRRLFVYTRHARMTIATLPRARRPGGIAIFVPAWDEAAVIGAMLRHCLREWEDADFHIFVGCYPNDRPTIDAVAAVAADDSRIIPVVTIDAGPTTKGDCLNALWSAMLRREEALQSRFKAVVLHDAEDVVHPDEIRLFDYMVERFDLVQIPVLPLVDRRSRWVAGHYLDEFAEAHGKYLVVREALGAAVPSAGVGCAFARHAIAAIAAAHGGRPFDPHCLTEDYELGLRIGEIGGRGAFVRMPDGSGGMVCTREFFPGRIDAAVRQKARWMTGIALAGWDRLGWRGNLAERWMRLRDRRALLASIVLACAYGAILLYALTGVAHILAGTSEAPFSPALRLVLIVNGFLLLWRLAMRCGFVTAFYGWREGLRSVPRSFIANIVAIMAARRAVAHYARIRGGRAPVWDKTAHHFPEDMAAVR